MKIYKDHDKRLYWTYGIFLLISFSIHFFHEPWRDEIQALLIVQHSQSLTELIQNIRYEGHPILWFIILYILKSVHLGIWGMKIIHWLFISGAVYILLFKSRLKLIWKLLLPFGYYFLFEYNAICRNYSIGILLLFLTIQAIEQKKWYLVTLYISLCFQCNVYMLLLSSSLWFFVFTQHIKSQTKTILLNSTIILSVFSFTIFYIIPPTDTGFAVEYNFQWKQIIEVICAYCRALVILPKLRIGFWNTNCLGVLETKIVGSLLLLFLSIYFFQFKKVFIFFLMSLLMIGGFLGIKYMGYIRHQGHLYLSLITSIWLISIYYPEKKFRFQIIFETIISCIFILQIYSSLLAYYYDYYHPFSNGDNVSNYLKETKRANYRLIAINDFSASTISGILQKNIYYLNARKEGGFVIWNNKRGQEVTDEIINYYTDSFSKLNKVIVIRNDSISIFQTHLKYLKGFTNEICGAETYFLYEYQK